MRWNHVELALAALFLAAPALAAYQGKRSPKAVNVGTLVRDAMILDIGDGQTSLAIWLPFEKGNDRFKATRFTWHTPFDVLSPHAPCPRCKEQLAAKWSYCPFCGTKAGTP